MISLVMMHLEMTEKMTKAQPIGLEGFPNGSREFAEMWIYLFIYTSYSLATVRLWRRLQIMVHCQVPGCYVCYLLGFAPERSFVLGL
jgi:hypothetical protein